jgi:2-keto-4-pentenoate hydratase/2-oxohepta-3-ene-1,7-dioic acid hydratase in catechol pathway
MKLTTFEVKSDNRVTIGAYVNGVYVDLAVLSEGSLPDSMMAFLEAGDAAMGKGRELAEGAESALQGKSPSELTTSGGNRYAYSEDEITLYAPVPKPGKIIHTACNFDAHLDELTTWEDPEWESHNWGDFHFEHPTGFLEAPSSVSASGASVEVPVFTKQLDYEIEIGIYISKRAYKVSVDEAFDYVAGYSIFNDLSARDIQAREHSNKVILMGKSFVGSCPFGPFLVTVDELSDPHNLDMKLRVNGDVRQDSNTSYMHYKTAELVSWWSLMGLDPGDVITSGSPPGVIAGMKDPQWLKTGDVIEASVAELGTLTTHIA